MAIEAILLLRTPSRRPRFARNYTRTPSSSQVYNIYGHARDFAYQAGPLAFQRATLSGLGTRLLVTHKCLARGYHQSRNQILLFPQRWMYCITSTRTTTAATSITMLCQKIVVVSHLKVLPHSYESACLGLFLVQQHVHTYKTAGTMIHRQSSQLGQTYFSTHTLPPSTIQGPYGLQYFLCACMPRKQLSVNCDQLMIQNSTTLSLSELL